jgi:hypothetical protein
MGQSSSTFEQNYVKALTSLPISNYQKEIINNRYVCVVNDATTSFKRTSAAYYALTNIITIAGVLIASLIVLNRFFAEETELLFWLAWTLSIVLAISNKFLYAFNISKKYVLNGEIVEKLRSEGWSFMVGIGRYKKYTTLDQRFEAFCARIEKLKLKAVESKSELEFVDLEGGRGGILAASPRPDDSFHVTLPPLRTHTNPLIDDSPRAKEPL